MDEVKIASSDLEEFKELKKIAEGSWTYRGVNGKYGLGMDEEDARYWALKWIGKSFDHDRYDALYYFARHKVGVATGVAKSVAFRHLKTDTPIELLEKNYAAYYETASSRKGLNMSSSDAKEWALENLAKVYHTGTKNEFKFYKLQYSWLM